MARTVDLRLSDEQAELRATVRQLLGDRSSSAQVRRAIESEEGFDRELWSQMAEMGLQAVLVPERYSGLGMGALESAIVLEEMGRVLYCGPFLATTAMATNALLLSGDDDACADLLPGIAAGTTIATLAVPEQDGRWDSEPASRASRRSGDSWVLDGAKTFVIDGHVADLLLVTAQTPAGLGLFAVSGKAPGLTRCPQPTLDLTRRMALVSFLETPARPIGQAGGAASVLAATFDRMVVALAAEQAGGAAECLRLSVDYAKQRVQFGVPIGSFQAIAHRCADMLLRVELSRSAVHYAAAAADQGTQDFPIAARVAAAYASRAFSWVATETIQVHGGIGFTWEHDAHLYYRRSKSAELVFGDPARHWEELARRVGL
jgi:alkylation response protein AidB-like acyl-CoA dehydrogenase